MLTCSCNVDGKQYKIQLNQDDKLMNYDLIKQNKI